MADISKRQLDALAHSVGATLRYPDGRHPCVAAEAPTRMVWVAGHVHELIEESYGLQRARTNIAERMRHGVVACTDAGCEWCESA